MSAFGRCNKPLDVTVMSDSEWALSLMTGVYKLNKKTAQEYHDALKEIKGIKDELELLGCNITFQHVDNGWVKSVVGH